MDVSGEEQDVKSIVREVLLDIPGAVGERLEVYTDGSVKATVEIPAEHAERASLIVARAAQ